MVVAMLSIDKRKHLALNIFRIQVPHLLTIPNFLVDLLHTQGMAITPHNVLMTVDDFILSSPHPPGPQWECIWKWCIIAG
jgi:hypothetical protein